MSVRNKIVYAICALALISVPIDAVFFSPDEPAPEPVEHSGVVINYRPTMEPTNIYDEFAKDALDSLPAAPVRSEYDPSPESELDKLITERAEEIAGEMIDSGEYYP